MDEIYFDNASTTAVDEEIITTIAQVMRQDYGNPSSLHSKGIAAEQQFNLAAKQVLTAIGAKDGRIIFTSGGTEGNNLAVFGAARALKKRGLRVITTEIEHSSVASPFTQLEAEGFEVVRLKPDGNGRVSVQSLTEVLTPTTVLVSVMMVNNEIGTIQPITELTAITHRLAPLAVFHCDGVQALGKIPLEVAKTGIDILTVSGHKIHAPKGIGAVYLGKNVRILPLIYGGGQQQALRPGTESVPLAVGMGAAAMAAVDNLSHNRGVVQEVKNLLLMRLSTIEGVTIISPQKDCSPFILSIAAEGYRAETMLHFLEQKGIFVSSGSACSKGAKSPVLTAMGLYHRQIDSALRISLSKYSTTQQAEAFVVALQAGMSVLKKQK